MVLRARPSKIVPGHPDFDILDRLRAAILGKVGGAAKMRSALPVLIRDAIDFVIDPVRTARTRIGDLDNVEKTFVGLKVEHYFRDLLDVPKGVRDLVIDGLNVDVKNTVGTTWMIPPESYNNADPCLLIATAEENGKCWLGLLVARPEYLNRPNRDQKRSVSSEGSEHILWIVEGMPFPVSRWAGVDMLRFRELRKVKGGTRRAADFFRENVGRRIHRTIIHALLFDQDDYMKRLRGNGGARDILSLEGILLLSGAYDARRVVDMGLPALARDEMMAVADPARKGL
jgi:hypothetical protein